MNNQINTRAKDLLQLACERLQYTESHDDYFYDFLRAFNFPLELIKQLREDAIDNSIDDHNDIALADHIYFMSLPASEEPIDKLLSIIRLEAERYSNMRFMFITNFKTVAAYDWVSGSHLFASMSDVANNTSFFEALLDRQNSPANTCAVNNEDEVANPPSITGITTDANKPTDSQDNHNGCDLGVVIPVTGGDPLPKPTPTPKLASPAQIKAKRKKIKQVSSPLSAINPACFGSVVRDDGHLLLSATERNDLLKQYPDIKGMIKPLVRTTEFLNGTHHFCLWLGDTPYEDINKNPAVIARVEKVRVFRSMSKGVATRESYSKTPHLFAPDIGLSKEGWLAFNPNARKNFKYMPFGFLDVGTAIALPMCVVKDATLYDFGVLMSSMHNLWHTGRAVNSKPANNRYRIKADYNTFPWPNAARGTPFFYSVSKHANNVLLVREEYPNRSLADLYHHKKMPDDLRQAHKELDRAVERLYRDEPFDNDAERLEFLLARHEQQAAQVAQVALKRSQSDSTRNR